MAHVKGEAQFIEDLPPVAGEAHLSLVVSPVAKGLLINLDTSTAQKEPGVLAVLTAKDFRVNRWGPIVPDQPILVEKAIRFLGEPLCVVVAETKQIADKAALLVKPNIKKEPPTLTIAKARQQNLFLGEPAILATGDYQKAMAEAPHTLEGSFFSKGQEHFYLESQSCIAYPEEDDCLIIHSSTQHPTEVQHSVAHSLGLAQSKVVCKVKRMGGAFGGKESQATPFALLTALATKKTKKCCRLHLTKDEDMVWTGKRHPFATDYKVGFDQEGRIKSLAVDFFSDGGAYLDLSAPVLQRAMLHIDNAYFLENARISGKICQTNTPPNTAFRGFGGPQGIAVIETIMETIATTLKKDALQVRKANLYGTKDRNITHYDQVIHNTPLPSLIEQLTVDAEYQKRRTQINQHNLGSPPILKGLALTPVKFGISFTVTFLNQGNALVNLHKDATVQVSTGATEMGQGVHIKIAGIIADTLGLPISSINIMITSTEKNHNTSATAASSGSDINGFAAEKAALAIKKRLALLAIYLWQFPDDKRPSPLTGHPEFQQDPNLEWQHVVFANSTVYDPKAPNRAIAIQELVSLAYLNRLSLGEYAHYKTEGIFFDKAKGKGNPFLYFTNGAAISEVEIDRYTGETKVTRTDILMDLGRMINEGIDRGQVSGAFIQGMGWLTGEDLVYEEGRLVTHSPTTYKIPNIQDIPRDFRINFIENPNNTRNIKGSKAVGEPPFMLALSIHAAIRDALSQAKGGKLVPLNIPATGEEILNCLS